MSTPEADPADSTFYLLDFDRTLVDTTKLHVILEQVAGAMTKSLTAESLQAARLEVESQHKTFDTHAYIQKILEGRDDEPSWREVQAAFIKAAEDEDVLFPYAKELLDELTRRNLPHGMLTFGNEAWQLAKIIAAKLDYIPFLITNIKEKGLILTGWKHGDQFIIPPALTKDFKQLPVKRIVFVDDKVVSFEGIPDGIIGYHAQPSEGEPFGEQVGSLPRGVTRTKGLKEVYDHLF